MCHDKKSYIMSCHCDLLPHDQLLRLILPFLLLALAPHTLAQPAANNFPPLPELLQYQASKSKQGTRWAPFRKYAMRRMRLPETVAASDNHLWGYLVSLPDSSFQASRPLDRQLKADGPLAFAVIDHPAGSLQLVFWDKRIYRNYAEWIARIGFTLSSQRPFGILQHPLLPQRGSQYPHRHHDLGRLLPDGDQRIKTLISNALALGSNGLFLDMQESGNALFFTSKRRRLLLLIDF